MSESLIKINELKNVIISKTKTARVRLEKLFDDGTFIETHVFDDAGVITGYGQIDGRLVYAISEDNNKVGGAFDFKHGEKIVDCQDNAMKVMAPIIYINDSVGAKLVDGNTVLSAYAKVIKNVSKLKGIIPQLTINLNNNVGIVSFIAEMSDFSFSTDDDTADFVLSSDLECIEKAREVIKYLPQNYMEKTEIIEGTDDINRMTPELTDFLTTDSKTSFDMSHIIKSIADDNIFIEVKDKFAKNILVGFIRLGGYAVGVVANNSDVKEGVLDRDAVDKAVKFIETCDLFNIPVLTLVDNDGITRKFASELLNVYALSEIPLVTLIVRRAYGSGYIAMCSKGIGADIVYAYPEARIGVMKSDALADILYENEIKNSKDVVAERKKRILELDNNIMSPDKAASFRMIDDIINPSETRKMLISAFDLLYTKENVEVV